MDIKALATTATEVGIKIIIALIVMLIAFAIINKIGNSLEKLVAKSGKLDKTIASTLSYVARIALKVLVLLGLISYLGINTAGIATIIASLGVGVGMAVNGAVANFAGGLLILVTRPFKVGDFVEMAGTMGTVLDIRLVHTKIATLDNKVVYVPNGTASGATVVNYSEKDTRRVDQTFHISYESDANKAIEILKALAERNGAVLKDPAPFVKISGALDSSIEITTRLWVKAADYWDVYFYMLENAKPAFDAAGISIPYPQVDVHMKN
ncbi:MAG: mechanosensitive ion channel [Firmicutes bacterium]|nr:mechanosensitive ion channel [Bacillota bacterium]MBR0516668.1 mechanosensitive ion channel [Bacillota bacterium]